MVLGLEAAGLTFDRFSGTSAGAGVAAAAAAGRLRAIQDKAGHLAGRDLWGRQGGPLRRLVRLRRGIELRGYLDPSGLVELLEEVLPDPAVLRIPSESLTVHYSDLAQGLREVVYRQVAPPWALRRAILASMSLPFVFPPVDCLAPYGRAQGLDGGLSDNVPLETAVYELEREPRGSWELWLVCAVGRPGTGRIEPGSSGAAGEALSRIVTNMLARESHASIDLAERRGWRRGRDFHVVTMDRDLRELPLIDFSAGQARSALLAGLAQGAAWS